MVKNHTDADQTVLPKLLARAKVLFQLRNSYDHSDWTALTVFDYKSLTNEEILKTDDIAEIERGLSQAKLQLAKSKCDEVFSSSPAP